MCDFNQKSGQHTLASQKIFKKWFTYNMVHLISCDIQSPVFGEVVDW